MMLRQIPFLPVTDDTDAINVAISTGGRCGGLTACVGSTTTPAVVYFPAGYEQLGHPLLLFGFSAQSLI